MNSLPFFSKLALPLYAKVALERVTLDKALDQALDALLDAYAKSTGTKCTPEVRQECHELYEAYKRRIA